MSFTPCADHNPLPPYNRTPRAKGERCETCKRIAIEGKIARRVIKDALKAGYELSVYDSGEITLVRSTDAAAIEEAMFTTDDDRLFFYKPGVEARQGWVWFVYGNSGWDVITDYTTNLEEVLAGANDLAEKLDN